MLIKKTPVEHSWDSPFKSKIYLIFQDMPAVFPRFPKARNLITAYFCSTVHCTVYSIVDVLSKKVKVYKFYKHKTTLLQELNLILQITFCMH